MSEPTTEQLVEPPKVPVHEAWSRVMGDVREIKKTDTNAQQGYSFRGIDATMNAVGPVLRKHGVVVIPTAEDIQVERYTTGRNNTAMKNVTARMRYTVIGPAGDSFAGVAYGEAADSGDKAVAKAQSVAYRVFLLQALTIPTNDSDPDSETHERAAHNPEADTAREELAMLCDQLNISRHQAVADFAKANGGVALRHATDPAPIRVLADKYRSEHATSNGVAAEVGA